MNFTLSRPAKLPGQISSINPRSPIGTQHSINSARSRQLCREIRPHPHAAGPIGLVLLVRDIVGSRVANIPDGPTDGVDDRAQVGVLVRNAGKGTPRPPEEVCAISNDIVRSRGNGAVVKAEPVDVRVHQTARGSQVAVGLRQDAQVACVEPAGGVSAEDEVGRADDERLAVDLQAGVGVERVLGAGELAGVVPLAGVLGAECDGLHAWTVRVGDVDVVECGVLRPDAHGT